MAERCLEYSPLRLTILTANGLRVSFGEREVLRGATLAIDDGERVGLVGRNGSGKTTMVRILAGDQEAHLVRGQRLPSPGVPAIVG